MNTEYEYKYAAYKQYQNVEPEGKDYTPLAFPSV